MCVSVCVWTSHSTGGASSSNEGLGSHNKRIGELQQGPSSEKSQILNHISEERGTGSEVKGSELGSTEVQ